MEETKQKEQSIWQLQEHLRVWHDQEYRRAYPTSEFTTGRTLAAHGERAWEDLTPAEQERKERVAYRLNCILFSLGTNISDSFREE